MLGTVQRISAVNLNMWYRSFGGYRHDRSQCMRFHLSVCGECI